MPHTRGSTQVLLHLLSMRDASDRFGSSTCEADGDESRACLCAIRQGDVIMVADDVPLIESKHLCKQYGATAAVQGVSFKVARGEVVGFLGPNGAGKSTTMKMLTGYLRPTAGHAFIGGVDVSQAPQLARRMLGYLPENAPMYDEMMVVDFLRFVAELRGVAKGLQPGRIRYVAERCGLLQVMGKDIAQLSKGFRQRVGLAQALLHDPDLLILDEPTSGLDPNQIVEIRALIRDLGRDKTVLISTHILPEVQASCSRVLIINQGKLVADDTPERLQEATSQGRVHLVVATPGGAPVDAAAMQTALLRVPDVVHIEASMGEGADSQGFVLTARGSADIRQAVFAAVVAQGWVLLSMQRERVSLEDTFRRLTHATADEASADKERHHAA